MKILAALTGLIFAPSAFAIVNIENLRMNEDQTGFSASSTISAKGKRGNTDEDEYALDGGIQWLSESRQRSDLLLFSSEQNRANQQTYSEEYFIHLRHTEALTEKWAWEIYAQHESEPLTDDRLRNLVGSNLRYRLDFFPFNGHGGVGLMQEQRSVEPTGQNKVERETTRFNFYLNSSHQLTETTDWKISLYAQPKTDNWDDVRAIAATGISVKINSTFALTLDLSYSHDSEPLLAQKEYDLSYKNGFNIKF
jgi:hypothetical protein